MGILSGGGGSLFHDFCLVFLDPRLVVWDFFHQQYYTSRWSFRIVEISYHT